MTAKDAVVSRDCGVFVLTQIEATGPEPESGRGNFMYSPSR